jgi:Bacterial PH domain
MGLLSGLLGNASAVDTGVIEQELSRILLPGEDVHRAYRVLRDLFIFTSKRLILVDKQGMTGSKTAFVTIPYKSIRFFAVENAGTFDLDAEMRIYIAGLSAPIQRQVPRGGTIFDVQAALAHYVTQ